MQFLLYFPSPREKPVTLPTLRKLMIFLPRDRLYLLVVRWTCLLITDFIDYLLIFGIFSSGPIQLPFPKMPLI